MIKPPLAKGTAGQTSVTLMRGVPTSEQGVVIEIDTVVPRQGSLPLAVKVEVIEQPLLAGTV